MILIQNFCILLILLISFHQKYVEKQTAQIKIKSERKSIMKTATRSTPKKTKEKDNSPKKIMNQNKETPSVKEKQVVATKKGGSCTFLSFIFPTWLSQTVFVSIIG